MGISLVAIGSIGTIWFGLSFKIWLCVFLILALLVVTIFVRKQEDTLVKSLKDDSPKDQDRILESLEEEHRKKILKRLGR